MEELTRVLANYLSEEESEKEQESAKKAKKDKKATKTKGAKKGNGGGKGKKKKQDKPSKTEEEMLNPNGQKWNIAEDGIKEDGRKESERPGGSWKGSINWRNIKLNEHGFYIDADAANPGTRTAMHCFLASFPMHYLKEIIRNTNEEIKDMPEEKGQSQTFCVRYYPLHFRFLICLSFPFWVAVVKQELNAQAFFVFLSILFMMCIGQLRNRRDYWRSEKGEGERVTPPFDFGRFGMTQDEWEFWFANIVWSKVDKSDKWHQVRGFIDAFNKRRQDMISASGVLTIDESMSAFKTRKLAKHHGESAPDALTKIPRKPEPIGFELKALIDALLRILLGVELVERADDMKTKAMLKEANGKAGTAFVLRLCEPWKHSTKQRTIYGDSAFASVNTAVACKKLLNANFIGLVKTCSSDFPKDYLNSLNLQRGQFKALTSEKDGVKLFAVGYGDGAQKNFIATCGTTQPAGVRIVTHSKIDNNGVVQKVLKKTNKIGISAEYFDHFHMVDVHNRYRQGILEIERNVKTKKFHLRLICTLLGMIMTDAYQMYKIDPPREGKVFATLLEFVEAVCFELKDNRFGDKAARSIPTRRAKRSNAEVSSSPVLHMMKPIIEHPIHAGKQAPIVKVSYQKRLQVLLKFSAYRTHSLLLTKYPIISFPQANKGTKSSVEVSGSAKKLQMLCSVCSEGKDSAFKRRSSKYCVDCSTDSNIVAICVPSNGEDHGCLQKHVIEKTLEEYDRGKRPKR